MNQSGKVVRTFVKVGTRGTRQRMQPADQITMNNKPLKFFSVMETQIEIFATSHAKRGNLVCHLCVDAGRQVDERTAVVIAANKFAKYATALRQAKRAGARTGWSLTAMHTIRVEVDGVSVFNSANMNFSAVAGGDISRAFTTSAVVSPESIRAQIISAYDLYSVVCDSAE